jgi:hypothetical protein
MTVPVTIEEVSINAKPFEDDVFILGVKGTDSHKAGFTAMYELSAVQVARLAMEAHTTEMSMRGVMRSKQRFSRLRKWLLLHA